MKKSLQGKNILIIFDFLELGGGTRVNLNMLKALSHEANVFLLTGIFKSSLNRPLLKQARNSCEKVYFYNLKPSKSYLKTCFTIALNTKKLITKILSKHEIDYIFLNLTSSGLGFLLSSISKKLKVMFFFHGALTLERESLYSKKDLRQWKLLARIRFKLANVFFFHLQKIILKKVDLIFVFSDFSKQILINYFKLSSHNIEKINPPIFIDEDKLKSITRKDISVSNKDFLIVIGSRLEPRKGVHLLLKAIKFFNEIKNTINIKVFILGPSDRIEYYFSLWDYYFRHSLYKNVFFLGAIKHDDVLKYFKLADLTILPSAQYETLGLTTLESLILNTPVLGFRSGATPELLGRVNDDLIVNSLSIKSLAKKIKWYTMLTNKKKQLIKKNCALLKKSYSQKAFLKSLTKYL
ncbi:MAG: glycosyltransferase family 4 protein [Candidatus Woesebacteria bacterium]|jgi:glycosyltransferase involved in cell wall biosynthesis